MPPSILLHGPNRLRVQLNDDVLNSSNYWQQKKKKATKNKLCSAGIIVWMYLFFNGLLWWQLREKPYKEPAASAAFIGYNCRDTGPAQTVLKFIKTRSVLWITKGSPGARRCYGRAHERLWWKIETKDWLLEVKSEMASINEEFF